MNFLIEFCTSNYMHGTEKIKNRLEGNEDYEVLEYSCLGHCEQCALTPISLVEGELIIGDTIEELSKGIEKKVEERSQMDSLFDKILKKADS